MLRRWRPARRKRPLARSVTGSTGSSKNPDAPNLAGDNADYIIKQLKAFQAGTRQDERMSIMAQGLSDEDMKQLAAWYSEHQGDGGNASIGGAPGRGRMK